MAGKKKRIYGVKINYKLLDAFLSNIGDIRKARKDYEISKEFITRIMLAVTQVNGCSMCSYFHTKEALKMGMDSQQIQNILVGELEDVPQEEAAALVFAQHYADTIGNYDQYAWDRIVAEYGDRKARAVLSYIRAIMVGNAQGNIFGALKSRLKGQPEPNSTFFMEMSVIFSDIFTIPFLIVKNTFKKNTPYKNNKRKQAIKQ